MSADRLREWARGLADVVGLDALGEMLQRIEDAADEGRQDAEVWTAVPLEPHERKVLSERLAATFGADLEINFRVEPSLIGGVIVRVGDRYLDGSLASKLGQLRQELVTGRVG